MSINFNESFPSHPFETLPENIKLETMMQDYTAMSQGFPYISNGAQGKLLFNLLDENKLPHHSAEATSVVSTFLSWDEFGGLYPTISHGLKALPKLLDAKWFHANQLMDDCEYMFGKKLNPNYSEITKKYLQSLYEGLSSTDDLTRIAYMVSFESHAERMITALWESLVAVLPVEKNKLKYFRSHVGGDDPAEAYHVEMTQKLISEVVNEENKQQFFETLHQAYALHINWCQDIIDRAVY